MSRSKEFTAQQMIDALNANNGIMAAAARELNCSRRTVARYVKEYSSVAEAYNDQRESLVDRLEFRFLEKVEAGDTRAILFGLRTIGRNRGWSEQYRFEHSGKDGGPIEHTTEIVVGFDDEPTEEEQAEWEREHQQMRADARQSFADRVQQNGHADSAN